MIQKFFTLVIVLMTAGGLLAEEISLSASVDRNRVCLDEQINLRLEISGSAANPGNPQLPDLSDFTVFSSGRSQNISIINGQMSSSLIFNYILTPRHTGKFVIGPIRLNYNGKIYQTQPINIEVIPAGQKSSSGSPAPQSVPGSAGQGIFVESFVDKNTAYVNEQITYTFRFYRRVRLLSNPDYQPPDFSGFWVEDLPPPRNYQTVVNGQRYLVTEIKTALFPTAPGSYNISGGRLLCQVEDFNPEDFWSDDFFRQFFSGGRQQQLKIPVVSVRILPLPEEGKPQNFSGAVGQYQISARIDKNKIRTGEALNLTINISGSGNIKTLPQPGISVGSDFRQFETVSSYNINKEGGKVSGTKTFQTVLIPENPGELIIQPVTFSYFDPAKRQYIQLSSSPQRIIVEGPALGASSPAHPASQPKVEILADIRYLQEVKRYFLDFPQYWKNFWFYLLWILANAIVGLAFFYSRWQERLSTDPGSWRRLRAYPRAKKYLQVAKKLLATKKYSEAGQMLSRTIDEYIADKFNISAEGLTNKTVETLLLNKNLSRQIEPIIKLRDFTALLRFAPSQIKPSELKENLEQWSKLLKMLEKELR